MLLTSAGINMLLTPGTSSNAAIITVLAIFINIATNLYTVAENATTEHIQEIFAGRCWDYQKFHVKKLHESQKWVEKNCTGLWKAFLKSFQKKRRCEVLPSDYEQYFELANPGMTPRNKAMFWSGTSEVAHELSFINNNFITLEDTFPGYIANELSWCRSEKGTSLDYTSCPAYFCKKGNGSSAKYAHWSAASKQFALHAQGAVTVMVNGSKNGSAPAYDPKTFFASIELPTMNANLVDQINIFVVSDLDQVPKEQCGHKSLKKLMSDIRKKGIKGTCQDNPKVTLSVLCDKYPHASPCNRLMKKTLEEKKKWEIISIFFIAATGILLIVTLVFLVICIRHKKEDVADDKF